VGSVEERGGVSPQAPPSPATGRGAFGAAPPEASALGECAIPVFVVSGFAMGWAKRISEHPWLSLTVSAATIVSTILAVFAFILPAQHSEPGEARENAAQIFSDIVGTWVLQDSGSAPWVVEYKPDGTYSLATPDGIVVGFYEARNGIFSSEAPELGLKDRGRYQLLDDQTLEMSGTLGVSIWKRRSG